MVVSGDPVLKRGIDVLLSSCFLLLALPVILICALLIKLDSEGPVFFRQRRIGRDFHPFQVFKLRTMEINRTGTAITLGSDPRVTHVGQWLRDYKLDELPQLWNVLRGEMSLVGPRPVIPALVDEFHAEYEKLLQFRPGITDPATLKYYRECEILAASSDPARFFKKVVAPDKLQLSLAYLEQATVWTDLRLLFHTLWAVLPHIVIRVEVTRHDVPESDWRPFANVAGRSNAGSAPTFVSGVLDYLACAEDGSNRND